MRLRRPPADQRPLNDPADLSRLWAAILDGEPLRYRALWLLFVDAAGCPVGPLVTLDDLPDGPYDVRSDDVVNLCLEFIDGPGAASSVALLLARPGGAPWTVSDRAWGRFLCGVVDAVATRKGSRDAGGVHLGRWAPHWAHQHQVAECRPA